MVIVLLLLSVKTLGQAMSFVLPLHFLPALLFASLAIFHARLAYADGVATISEPKRA